MFLSMLHAHKGVVEQCPPPFLIKKNDHASSNIHIIPPAVWHTPVVSFLSFNPYKKFCQNGNFSEPLNYQNLGIARSIDHKCLWFMVCSFVSKWEKLKAKKNIPCFKIITNILSLKKKGHSGKS